MHVLHSCEGWARTKNIVNMSKETLDHGLTLLRMGSTESQESLDVMIQAGSQNTHACMCCGMSHASLSPGEVGKSGTYAGCRGRG